MSLGGTVLAHDSVTAYGGGERTLEALLPLFPDAPLFTAVFKPPVTLAHLGHRLVRASFLQRAPLPTRLLKPLFPLAFASLHAPAGTELILSSSSGYAKGLRHPGAVHVTYVHTPIRRVWNTYHRAAQRRPRGPLRAAEALSLRLLRRWDLASMRRVDHVVANSQNTARQIQRIYGRTAMVVPPPVRTSFFVPGDRAPGGDYLLAVARLDPYKRIDLAIAACRALGLRLVVVGDGVERTRLSAGADRQVTFLGIVDDLTLRSLYQGCRALRLPRRGGLRDRAGRGPGVRPARRGVRGRWRPGDRGGRRDRRSLRDADGRRRVVAALQRLDRLSFDPERIRQHAVTFDEAAFQRRMDVRREGGRVRTARARMAVMARTLVGLALLAASVGVAAPAAAIGLQHYARRPAGLQANRGPRDAARELCPGPRGRGRLDADRLLLAPDRAQPGPPAVVALRRDHAGGESQRHHASRDPGLHRAVGIARSGRPRRQATAP